MTEIATLASGCFWCTEAIFRRLNGVVKVTSGYSGGTVDNPTYEQVCSGTTGHAEAIQVEYDASTVLYETLLEVFFALHDPTTPNQQGADIGSQYRSAIFYHNEQQRELATEVVKKIKNAVTEVVPFVKFYPAEIEHQSYYEINPSAGYCSYVISPKIKKLLANYRDLVKPGY